MKSSLEPHALLEVSVLGLVGLQSQASGGQETSRRRVSLGPYPSHHQLPSPGRQKGKEAISLHPVSSNVGAGGSCFLC